MSNDACKNMVGLISQCENPFKVQSILESYCSEKNLVFNDFSGGNLPEFMLVLAKERDDVSSMDDKMFLNLLCSQVPLSNSERNNM